MRLGIPRPTAALLLLAVWLGPTAAFAQGALEECLQRGFRPGTVGFYQCLQGGGGEGSEPQSSESTEQEAVSGGDPENAATDLSGSSMEGATAPDPDILKQLNGGNARGR